MASTSPRSCSLLTPCGGLSSFARVPGELQSLQHEEQQQGRLQWGEPAAAGDKVWGVFTGGATAAGDKVWGAFMGEATVAGDEVWALTHLTGNAAGMNNKAAYT
ncbi:hypothetical protein F4604DRAFT_1688753 [Suillus subluteus]|nr:hypothetical protein F4604DRAFT_1688753 [Suillus subluteus]